MADMSKQAGFVDACAGRSPDDLPLDVPVLVVRAGRDGFPGLNAALDTVLARALERNVPLWLINHATGSHAFDLDEDTRADEPFLPRRRTGAKSQTPRRRCARRHRPAR